MLGLALFALATATDHHSRVHARIHPRTHVRVARAHPLLRARPLPKLLGPDATEARRDPAQRYRVMPERVTEPTTMDRAMQGAPQTCETTGAPVCPSKPRPLLAAELGPQ
jgi:hypothetical protein